jgi:hypothetical protein
MAIVPILLFLLALFALIAAMHRGVSREASARLRTRFDREGAGGEVARHLMRESGYTV